MLPKQDIPVSPSRQQKMDWVRKNSLLLIMILIVLGVALALLGYPDLAFMVGKVILVFGLVAIWGIYLLSPKDKFRTGATIISTVVLLAMLFFQTR